MPWRKAHTPHRTIILRRPRRFLIRPRCTARAPLASRPPSEYWDSRRPPAHHVPERRAGRLSDRCLGV